MTLQIHDTVFFINCEEYLQNNARIKILAAFHSSSHKICTVNKSKSERWKLVLRKYSASSFRSIHFLIIHIEVRSLVGPVTRKERARDFPHCSEHKLLFHSKSEKQLSNLIKISNRQCNSLLGLAQWEVLKYDVHA